MEWEPFNIRQRQRQRQRQIGRQRGGEAYISWHLSVAIRTPAVHRYRSTPDKDSHTSVQFSQSYWVWCKVNRARTQDAGRQLMTRVGGHQGGQGQSQGYRSRPVRELNYF